MPEARAPLWLTVAAVVLGGALCVHLAATAVFVGPPNVVHDALRTSLSSYMRPLFEQNWSLFAPTPIRVEYSLQVRGWYEDGTSTEWVDATEAEIQGNVVHNVAPSRAGIVTRRLADQMAGEYRRLTPAEQAVLTGHYDSDAWPRMVDRLDDLPEQSSSGAVDAALRLDRALAAYATQFAWSWWGRPSGIRQVQVRIEAAPAPAFADRRRDVGDDTVVYEFGRRPLYRYDGQDTAAFAEAIGRFRR